MIDLATPIILTGTRKDQVGEAALGGLSARLHAELRRREGTSGIAEKAARPKS